MNAKQRDLLAAYAHGLLDCQEAEHIERLARGDPEVAGELQAIRQSLDAAAAWRPAIPFRRLEQLPIPRLEHRAWGRRGGLRWFPGLLKAAALILLGFSLGYAASAAKWKNADRSAAGRESPAANVSLARADDLLANAAIAHLAYTVGSNWRLAEYLEQAPETLGRLAEQPTEWKRNVVELGRQAWDALPVPPLPADGTENERQSAAANG
ncbi:MAG: hypothetical protein NTW86_22415 [Candidatus Sumerlaeota bacterium]|nr:hypothetical protein [Candidatus Sumerlaeota bacterium]